MTQLANKTNPGRLDVAAPGLLPVGSLASPTYRVRLPASAYAGGMSRPSAMVMHWRIAFQSAPVTHCATYWRRPSRDLPTFTLSSLSSDTVLSMSHLAQVRLCANRPGRDAGSRQWWCGSTGAGGVVLSGMTVHKAEPRRRRGDTTTTGRTLTISGGLNPVSKLHISTVPGSGRKGKTMRGCYTSAGKRRPFWAVGPFDPWHVAKCPNAKTCSYNSLAMMLWTL